MKCSAHGQNAVMCTFRSGVDNYWTNVILNIRICCVFSQLEDLHTSVEVILSKEGVYMKKKTILLV